MAVGRLLPEVAGEKPGRLFGMYEVAGPSSYPSGGFEVVVEDVKSLENFIVKVTPNPTQLREDDNYVYSISWSVTGNKVKIVIKRADVTASPASYSEPTGVDFSGVKFIIEFVEK